MYMARKAKFSKPLQTRLNLDDFRKFEALRQERGINAGQLARELISRSLSEVEIS
jgi:hypothetical protein